MSGNQRRSLPTPDQNAEDDYGSVSHVGSASDCGSSPHADQSSHIANTSQQSRRRRRHQQPVNTLDTREGLMHVSPAPEADEFGSTYHDQRGMQEDRENRVENNGSLPDDMLCIQEITVQSADSESNCVVCFNELKNQSSVELLCCGCTLCVRCVYNISLWKRQPGYSYRVLCPNCRSFHSWLMVDVADKLRVVNGESRNRQENDSPQKLNIYYDDFRVMNKNHYEHRRRQHLSSRAPLQPLNPEPPAELGLECKQYVDLLQQPTPGASLAPDQDPELNTPYYVQHVTGICRSQNQVGASILGGIPTTLLPPLQPSPCTSQASGTKNGRVSTPIEDPAPNIELDRSNAEQNVEATLPQIRSPPEARVPSLRKTPAALSSPSSMPVSPHREAEEVGIEPQEAAPSEFDIEDGWWRFLFSCL